MFNNKILPLYWHKQAQHFLLLVLWYCVFTEVRTSEAQCEWVIHFLTLHTSRCLNSPTSEPLVNVGISILAFPLFVLFACVRFVLCCSSIFINIVPWEAFFSWKWGTVSWTEGGSRRTEILEVKNILSGYSQHAVCPFRGVKSSLFTDLITVSGISLARIYHKAPLSLHLIVCSSQPPRPAINDR